MADNKEEEFEVPEFDENPEEEVDESPGEEEDIDYGEPYDDENAQEELFKENPLKAMWIKIKEIEERQISLEESLTDEEDGD